MTSDIFLHKEFYHKSSKIIFVISLVIKLIIIKIFEQLIKIFQSILSMKTFWMTISEFMKFVYEVRITVEKEEFNFSQNMQILFSLLHYLQLQSLYLSCLQQSTYQSQVINVQAKIAQITRPYEYIGEQYDMIMFYFTIPLITYTVLIANLIWIRVRYCQGQGQIMKQFQNIQSFYQYLLKTFIFLGIIFQSLIFTNFIELSLYSFYQTQNNIDQIYIGVFSFISIIITLILQILSIKYFDVGIFQLNLAKFHNSSTDYLQTLLVGLLIITTGVPLIISKHDRRHNVDTYLPNQDQRHLYQFLKLFLLSYCLTFAIILTIGDIQSQTQNEFLVYVIFSLLSFPVTAKILISILDYRLIRIFQEYKNINIQHFKVQQIKLYMDWIKNEQNNYTKIVLLINTQNKNIQNIQKLKKEQLIYYWFVKENDVFYHMIINVKDKNLKLLYYIQFIKLNFTRKVIEIEQKQKYQEGKFECSKQLIIESQILNKSLYRDKILKYMDIRFKNLGIIEQLKLQLMKKSTINQFLQTNNREQEDMEQMIGLFVKFEENNEIILDNLQIAINLKLQLINLIQIKNIKTLFKTSYDIVRQLFQIEQLLISHYNAFPSQKIQTYLIFFFAEIQNDILGAFYFSNMSAMTEGNLIKLQMKMNGSYDIISENIEYLTLILDEATYTFNIDKFSKGLMNTLFEKDKLNTLNDILPLGLQSIHVEYIEGFLLTGRSKYFRQFSKAFYRGKNKYLAQIDAVFDFLQTTSDPSYIVFLRQIQLRNPHVWVDQDLNITGITEDFNDLFSLPEKYHSQFQKNIDMRPIQQLIPQFDIMVSSNQKQDILIHQADLSIKPFLKDIQGVYTTFICEILIFIRTSPSNIKYFIIEIFNSKPQINETIQEDQSNNIIDEQPIQNIPSNNKILTNFYQYFDTNIQMSLYNSPRSENNMIQDQNQDLRDYIVNQPVNQNELINQTIKEKLSQSFGGVRQFQEDRSQNLVMNGFAIESQASSMAGIKCTKYYKRYQTIHRFMNGNSNQYEIKIVFILLGFIVALGAMQSALYLGIVNNDLALIKQNIEVLKLRTSFSGAQDSYLICINSIAYHSIQQNMKKINATEYKEQIKYSAFRLANLFSQLKINYQNFIQNPSLSSYLVGKYMKLNQKNGTKIVQINTTINEAFVLYIESSFGYQNMVERDSYQLDLQASYIVFQISNYRVYKNKIEEINDAMVQLSLNKSFEFQDKIHYLYYPIICASIIIMVISLHYYIIILKKLERLSKIFNNSFINYYKFETERLNNLNKILTYDSQNYQEYKLDIFDNENELIKLDENLQFNISNRSQQKQDLKIFVKMPFIIKYICFLVAFLLLYSSFHLINYIQFITYIKKLPNTIQYYDLMVELQSSSSSLYISRQLTSQISNKLWFFFNDTQKQEFLQSFNDSLLIIQNYLSTYGNIDMNQMLVSSNYVNRYNSFLNENLCNQIEQPQLIEWFCVSYIGGSLKRGFITAISSIMFELQNQYSESNNFSQQIITEQSYLEGGLILGSIIKQICETINQDMLEKTINLTNQIMIISATYLALFLPVSFCLLYKIKQKFDEYFKISLRIITLLPQSYLYLDNQIDGELRQMAILFQI
ncbi:hypothetical protein pb186bvf_006353 [Paramecium bursaria]